MYILQTDDAKLITNSPNPPKAILQVFFRLMHFLKAWSIDLCLCCLSVCCLLFSSISVLKTRYSFWIQMPKCIHWHLVIQFTTLAFEYVVLQLPGHPIISPQVNDTSKQGVSKTLFERMVLLFHCNIFELKVLLETTQGSSLLLVSAPFRNYLIATHNYGLQKKAALPPLLRRQ